MPLTRVLLIGASGNLGSLILGHLLASTTKFEITALTRKSSSTGTSLPPSVSVKSVADDYPGAELVEAFRDVDVVISAISMMGMHEQYKFIDAAVEAKVKRYIPTEFGLDSLPDWLVELRPMFRIKHDVRDYLIALADKGAIEWTGIVCNVFFEMGVQSGFFQFDWSTKSALLIGDGGTKWVATTLDTVALAVARAIETPRETLTRNKLLLIQDFRTSQKQILDAIQSKTNTTWKVESVVYDDWLDQIQTQVRNGDDSALSKLTFATVVTGSDWEGRPEFANALLELPTRPFDQAMEAALRDI